MTQQRRLTKQEREAVKPLPIKSDDGFVFVNQEIYEALHHDLDAADTETAFLKERVERYEKGVETAKGWEAIAIAVDVPDNNHLAYTEGFFDGVRALLEEMGEEFPEGDDEDGEQS